MKSHLTPGFSGQGTKHVQTAYMCHVNYIHTRHYITLHCLTFTLHFIIFHYITLHNITSHTYLDLPIAPCSAHIIFWLFVCSNPDGRVFAFSAGDLRSLSRKIRSKCWFQKAQSGTMPRVFLITLMWRKTAQTVSIYSISRIQVCIIRTKQNAITYDCMLVA